MDFYLAVDTHEKKLVVDQVFDNWPDAFLAAVSRGKAKWKRYKDGYMRPVMRNGRLWNDARCGGGSDYHDKFRAAECLREGLKESHRARYKAMRFLSFDGGHSFDLSSSDDDEEKIKDALLYGRQAGVSILLDGRLVKEDEALS